MRSYLIAVFISLVCNYHLCGQAIKYLKNEATLLVENDAFTLNLYKDQYYSSGIFPAFRFVKDTTAQRKIIQSIQLNHRIYTPKDIMWRNEDLFDRPYAGQLSATLSREAYLHAHQYLKIAIELGWMGPSNGVGNMHRYWHKILNMGVPKGWGYQINDTPIALIHLKYGHSLLQFRRIEILSETNLTAGTTNNLVRQEVTFRFGRFFSIDRSSYFSGQLGSGKKLLKIPEMNEIYVFYAPGYERVFYNASIDGNFIGDASLFVSSSKKNVIQHRYGIMMSWPSFDLGMTGYIRSPETIESTGHYYVGVRMNQRF